MHKLAISALLLGSFLSSGAKAETGDAIGHWVCRLDTNEVKVTLDDISHKLTVEDASGIEEGFAIRTVPQSREYVEWYLPRFYEQIYYLRLSNKTPGLVDFRYCWGCKPYRCEPRG